MATVPDLIHAIKDTEELPKQVEALKQLTQIIDPAKNKLAMNFLSELAADDIYYPELRPYAQKCLEFIAKKFNLDLKIPEAAAPAAEHAEAPKPAPPAAKGPAVVPAPAGSACAACAKALEGNCIAHEVPVAGKPRTLHFCSKPCYGDLMEIVEKLNLAEAMRKATGEDLLERLAEGAEEPPEA